MIVRKKTAKPEAKVRVVNPAGSMQGKLKSIGGSRFDDWNNILANQTIKTLWVFKNSDEQQIIKQENAAVAALAGIGPKDEIEGMIAAQLVACHNATMECHRRAMHPEQTFEGRREGVESGEQALSDIRNVVGSAQPSSWKGSAEGHGRTRPRPRRRPSHCRQRRDPGGWVRIKIKGTTPCTCTCTRQPDAEHGPAAGARASRQQ
jgi:hypothetical protein